MNNGPRRPRPPPPRPFSTGSATPPPMWAPRGPPRGATVPPRPPFPTVPRPPWSMPPRPLWSMRPPMQPSMIHRPLPPVPRPRPTLTTQDPDTLWLAAFTEKHLASAKIPIHDRAGKREPPLRFIRERLAELREKLDELETVARELVHIQQVISTIDDELMVARLRAQAERKRNHCGQLRTALDKLQDPKPFGLGLEKYRDALSFTKRLQQKAVYRVRQKERIRAEHTIRQGLQVPSTNANDTVVIPEDRLPNTVLPTDEQDDAVQSTDDQASRRNPHHERETARKVLLAVELREARQGAEMTSHERQAMQEAHEQATTCLRKKRKCKRRREKPPRDAQTTEIIPRPVPTSGGANAVKECHVLPLRDPYATDMETLIAVRRRWDYYLCPPTVHGASAIPPHYVIPPATPATPWAQYVVHEP